MQQDTLVASRDVQDLGHLVRIVAFDVSEGDDRALPVGQRGQRRSQLIVELGDQRMLLRQRPRRRWLAPMTRKRLAGALEPCGVDRGALILCTGQAAPGDDAMLPRPRRFAVFARIRYTQVLSDERPSNVSMPLSTASQASCTTSAADSSVETNVRASRSIPGDHASTASANTASSPEPSRAASSSSGGMLRSSSAWLAIVEHGHLLAGLHSGGFVPHSDVDIFRLVAVEAPLRCLNSDQVKAAGGIMSTGWLLDRVLGLPPASTSDVAVHADIAATARRR
jgi:hypothetical protein